MRCATYENQERCQRAGMFALFAPDGRRVPGGPDCEEHALQCIAEYWLKLEENWTARPIDVYGREIPGARAIDGREALERGVLTQPIYCKGCELAGDCAGALWDGWRCDYRKQVS